MTDFLDDEGLILILNTWIHVTNGNDDLEDWEPVLIRHVKRFFG